MRIALVSFNFGEYCTRLASALASDSDTLLILDEKEAKEYNHLVNNNLHLLSFANCRLRQVHQQANLIRQLVNCIQEFNPDVIHLQVGHLWFNMALPLLRSYPLVVTVHDPVGHTGDGSCNQLLQWGFDWGCHCAAEVITHNEQMRAVLLRRMKLRSSKVHVIPHLACGDDSAQAYVHEEGSTVLFFGRIWEYKGLEYLIRAEPFITSKVPNVRIVIAGTGEDFSRYRRIMKHPDRFIICDQYVANCDREQLFRQANVVVLPYIDASQSGVIPMAYSYGKPVVATRVGGLPSQVDDGITGYLVTPRDEIALANAIVRLLCEPDLARRLGSNGNRKSRVEWSADVVARKTRVVYESAIARI